MQFIIELFYLTSIVIGAIVTYYTLDVKKTKFNVLHEYPPVTIVIPARNEENNIEACLESLLKIDYPEYEILVIDGNSTDNTRAICSKFEEVKVIEEPKRENNWVGKPWACHIGYLNSKNNIILFTDADTTHSANSLKKSISKLLESESSGFVSMITTQKYYSFWEHLLSVVFLIISLSVNGTKGNSKAQIANGQYMLFTKSTYNAIGGHVSVKNSIIEDLALGTIASSKGFQPYIIYNHDLVSVRMYRNLSEIFEGFSKNLALGVKQIGLFGSLKSIVATMWGMGFILAIFSNNFLDNTFHILDITWIFGYITFSILLYYVETSISEKGSLYVMFYPIYFVMFWIIVITSMIKTFIRKEVTWKGEAYRLNS